MGEIRDFKSNKSGKPPREASPRRLAAIIAGDIAGYSRLMEIDEEGTHGRVKRIEREPHRAQHRRAPRKARQNHRRRLYCDFRQSCRSRAVRHRHPAKHGWTQRIAAEASLDRVSDWRQSWRRHHRSRPTFTAMASILLRVSRALPILARFTSRAAFTSRSRTSWFADMSRSEIAKSRTSPIRSGSTACFRIRPPFSRTRKRRENILIFLLSLTLLVIASGALWYVLWQPHGKVGDQASVPVSPEMPKVLPSPAPPASNSKPRRQPQPVPPVAPAVKQAAPQPQPLTPVAPAAKQAAPPAQPALRPPHRRRAAIREPEMKTLRGGSFTMGSNDDVTEKPLHQVTIKPFAISQISDLRSRMERMRRSEGMCVRGNRQG